MKIIYSKNLITLLCLLFSLNVFATKITAVPTGGNWNSNGTWDLGRQPTCGDTIIIPAGVTVTIPANVLLDAVGCAPVTLQCAGRITFSSGKKLRLNAGGCVQISVTGSIVPSGAGGGSSELIEIAGQDWWKAADGTLLGSSSPTGVDLGCGILLPVELINFELENINEKLTLYWTTSSERDNDYFVVERSRNGSYWEEIGIVKGSGNSSSEIVYNIIDANPFIGVSYYRLTQFNYNGVANIIGTQSFEFITTKYLLYPIPVNKLMFIEGDKLANSVVKIFNSVGEEIEIKQSFVGNKISFNFREIKNGAYFVSIESDKTKKTERIIVVHK